jgi:elongator complex protein 3
MSYLPLPRIKPVRSISGVNVVAVMSPPHPCPHGRCAYCPSFPGVPNSYTGKEPSAMRGLQHSYDPYAQVMSRIVQLRTTGHSASKVELIIQGGTFPATDPDGQRAFIKGCLDAIAGARSRSFEEAVANAERSRSRNVGITLETRPDCCDELKVDLMLEMGVTRVELGVQTIYDDIYRLVERGHTVDDVIEATRRLKDAGLKVCYHIMPGLPGAGFDRDLEAFEKVFGDPSFRPDMLKIYPCLVIEGTKLYDWWSRGLYSPYTTEEAVELLAQVKAKVPEWIRIMRVQRDIPAQLIIAGVKKSNLRQLVWGRMNEKRLRCRCIRCREVGHRSLIDGVSPDPSNLEASTIEYEASGGREFFISIEDRVGDILVGYLRLRLPSESAHRPEVKQGKTALVRELHVCGNVVPIGSRSSEGWQHRGYGRILLKSSEEIARRNGARRILVTSAIGVREYFRGLGYERVGPYMGRALS